jgi:methionyl-tRNA formyltransferase
MRIVFMGSAELSCPSLETLLDAGHEIAAVVTQPDRPRGRNLKLAPSPVKVLAESRGIAVLTPEKINLSESGDALRSLAPDLIVVVAYGQILRSEILRIPQLGCLNMHTSLLPKYRGAAPIQWAIANGERTTGVTAMFMNERMDAGDIICQSEFIIADDDTGGSLHDKLALGAAELLGQTIEKMRSGMVPRRPQAEADATLAPKLTKKDGKINWTLPSDKIYNRVRAFNPWPCCYCEVCAIPRQGVAGGLPADVTGTPGSILRVLKSRAEKVEGKPGEIVDVSGEGPLVACGHGGVRLIQVQPEGRKVMSGAEYLRGHGLKAGDFMG